MTATAALPLPGGGHRGRRRDVTFRACRPRVCACLLACAIYIASRQPGYQLAIAAELQRMRDGLSDAQSSLRQHETAVETTAGETVAAASELARLMTSNVQTRSWQLAAAALLLLACAIVALCVCATRQPSMRVQLVTLQAREDTTFKQLRALRREISRMREAVATKEARAAARAAARVEAANRRALARRQLWERLCRCWTWTKAPVVAHTPLAATERAVPAPSRLLVVRAAGPEAPLREDQDAEGRAIHDLLSAGKLLVFTLDANAAAGGGGGGGGGGSSDVFSYRVLEPRSAPPECDGDEANTASSGSLQEAYQRWRSRYLLATGAEAWADGLCSLQDAQLERFLDALLLLDLDHADGAVVALLRLHDLPNEYAMPLRFGDLLIAWSPQRDAGFLSLSHRATCNAQSVTALHRWCSLHAATAQFTLIRDAASSSQSVNAELEFNTVYRKLFQVSRIAPGRHKGGLPSSPPRSIQAMGGGRGSYHALL